MNNYLFYSKRCESSANFIRIIQNKGIINMFQLMCIDQMSREQIINLGIKFTPMVVIRDMTGRNPSTTYEGKDAFVWLDNIVRFREQNMAKIVENNRKKILQSNREINKEDNIMGFQNCENLGISDNFSYTADNLENVAQPKSYMGINTDQKIITFNINEKPLSQREMDIKMKEIKDKKEQQDNTIHNMIETQLKQSIINKLSN
jgi:hypothetical protein